MTDDIMFKITSFVGNVMNVAFTDDDGIPWFETHVYGELVLKTTRNNARQMFLSVNNGVHKDEIKPFTKYVNTRGTVVKLFDAGGVNFTPVMNILGLLTYTMRVPENEVAKNVREMAEKSLVNFIVGDPKYIENTCVNVALSTPIQELLLKSQAQQRASGGASITESPMQVLNMCVYDVLLHLLSSPLNRFFFCDRYAGRVRAGRGPYKEQARARGVLGVPGEETCSPREGIFAGIQEEIGGS
jgi:hypothetical protein